MRLNTPPGWPRGVPPPDADEWRSRAVGWLLDLCPADYRGHPVLARHPVALARLAAHHVEAGLEAQRRARATARERLGDVLPPGAMAEVLEVLDVEQARLLAARRGVELVETALRGQRFVPRL
ncbi:hypothetical protein HJG43_05505 [Kineosporiaceae bacterium SCSIO 59966]|nr:hypothetical protein HJG43_05505 [Kineosporiaceae bacterium SCSIO 59966]